MLTYIFIKNNIVWWLLTSIFLLKSISYFFIKSKSQSVSISFHAHSHSYSQLWRFQNPWDTLAKLLTLTTLTGDAVQSHHPHSWHCFSLNLHHFDAAAATTSKSMSSISHPRCVLLFLSFQRNIYSPFGCFTTGKHA